MRDIAIYGAGGFGRETALMIEQINAEAGGQWNLIGFFDDGIGNGTEVDGLALIGGIREINAYSAALNVVLCVADPSIRRKLRTSINNGSIEFPPLIHPTALAGSRRHNQIKEGVIITAGNILTTGIHLGPFAIVNLSCTIGHDIVIGSFSTLMPSCSISGGVTIGEEVLVGSGARILPEVSIGHRSKIGAGAVVLTDVQPGETVVGIPARAVKRRA